MSTPAIYQRHGKGIKPLDVLTRFPKLGCLQLSVSQAACFNHFNPKVSAVNSKSRKGSMGQAKLGFLLMAVLLAVLVKRVYAEPLELPTLESKMEEQRQRL